ncbi:MAG: ferredoxin [Deltaproteobacteria bacterium]|nr:ferredoxin [Deltaproteobacteria bacterium]
MLAFKRMAESHWQRKQTALQGMAEKAAQQVENFLALENYYRGAQKGGEALEKSFGTFGSDIIDLKALSSTLKRSFDSRTMEKGRYERLNKLSEKLRGYLKSMKSKPPGCGFVELKKGQQAVLKAFEDHMSTMTDFFATVRLAGLESRGKYDPAEHDAFFKDFNWRQLDSNELSLCPPFIVLADSAKGSAAFGQKLGDILPLLTSGSPLKVLLPRTTLHSGVEETGRAAALAGADLTLLFLGLRNVFFLQASAAGNVPLEDVLGKALDSPRPAVISLHAPGGRDFSEGREMAEKALLSRGFPHFLYDPDKAADLVSCLDLSGNPGGEDDWARATIEFKDQEGNAMSQQVLFTFADYAALDPEFAAQFRPLDPAAEGSAVRIDEYLAMTSEQRRGRTPFVSVVDSQGALTRLTPSSAMIAQTVDRLHQWRSLQALEGTRNPHVQAAETKIRQQVSAEKETAIAGIRAEMEEKARAQGEQAVSAAMRNLAQKLAGLSPMEMAAVPAAKAAGNGGSVSASSAAASAAPAAAPVASAAAEEAAPPSEAAWIDERLCTSCDDCLDINKKIFAYNSNKKAIIKDPKGGPYKDIVRAAEKCASDAIHPGLPLNPAEKDVDKWVKRAEPYM